MSAEFKIGRLRYNWVGTWTPSTVYGRDNVVLNDGKAYVCLVPNTSSAIFYNDLYTTFPCWQQMTDGKTWLGTWSPSTIYGLGNIVIFGGKAYYCNTNHTSSSLFETNAGYWSEYTEFVGWHPVWTINTEYGVNDVVRWGGIVYKCTNNHVSASSTILGLEANQSAWTIYYFGINYTGAWQSGARYKANDLVKLDGDIYSCITYNNDGSFTPSKWSLWLPGQQFELVWSNSTAYQIGDAVVYGGNAYLSKTANNTGNIPSIDSGTNWGLFNQGYSIQGAWNSVSTYATGHVVTRNGMLYEATTNSTNQDPSLSSMAHSYNSTGSSGTTLVIVTSFTGNTTSTSTTISNVSSFTGLKSGIAISGTGIPSGTTIISTNPGASTLVISNPATATNTGTTITFDSTSSLLPGMIVSGVGFTQGQMISSITNSTTIVLDRAPDGSLTNAQSLNFIGVNSAYWSLLVPGKNWTNIWATGTNYLVGDIVKWINNTYSCIQDHTASTVNSPNNDTSNTYWVVLIANNQNNSMTTYGDLETYSNGTYTPVHIGTNTYNLRVNNNIPNWQKINVVPAVYYVDTYIGQDISTYGVTWDQPWQTIKYACNFVGQGRYFANASALIQANKGWMISEMTQWMYYQMANNISPFSPSSLWDPFYTQRDAGYIIDAIVYDMRRGGNSQTVAATLRFFYYGSQTQIVNSLTESVITYIAASVTYLQALMQYVVLNQAPPQSYQTLNGISGINYINQYTNPNLTAEAGTSIEITSLMTILITALTNQNTYQVPTSNSGITAIINVKTGTYNEYLPITVPENVSIVGDELRSVTVQPATSVTTICTQTINSTGTVIVNSTLGVPISINSITNLSGVVTITFSAQTNNVFITGSYVSISGISVSGYNGIYPVRGSTLTSVSYSNSTTAAATGGTITQVLLQDNMPLQFVSPYVNNASTTFGGVISGKTYYVIGSSLTANSFKLNDNPTINFTGTTVTGSNIISNVTSISNLVVGMNVTGSGIPVGTTVTGITQAISSIATITISQNATASLIFQNFIATGNQVILADGTGSMIVYAGDSLKNMWLMRNGTTMRNLSNFGLKGTLTATNQYGTARPTGGAYVGFDPGTGPDDSSVWIRRKSPYIQNVTNFGDGCVGFKIDGTLHAGGNKSMVSNDFTQVLSDGIGVWCTGSGAITECVSVFSYYNYIGHFAENGGRIRSTNGNSSYGTFGVVSEGYDPNEVPLTGTIFNQSQQVQATVSNAFGTADQLLKLNYINAGSAYYLPTTNMLKYSNNFAANAWSNDGNLSFIKNNIAPTGYTEAWLLTSASATPSSGYLQQSININPAGYSYTNISGLNQGGATGVGATFDVVITNTAYVVTVHSGSAGSGYQTGNQILIKGSSLGGVDGTNDLTITVGNLAGTGIGTISSATGVVPTGSAQSYTLSLYVYVGTSPTIDIQAVFSGSSTVTSGISYNFSNNTVTPYSGTSLTNSANGGVTPAYYGSQKTLVAGWYRIWMAVNDLTGLNTALTFKVFPSGANTPIANTYSIIYGSQLAISKSTFAPNYYLETTTSTFTAYANFEVVGAGSGAILSGDEIRSQAVFNARVTTDNNGFTGGAGYATSSNTAQAGNTYSIQISAADPGLYSYVGMRMFIQSGTGAGQYGYIAYYNKGNGTDANGVASKTALIVQESFESLSIIAATYSATPANNLLTIQGGSDLSKLYVNQAVQFLPTYYTTTVTSTSVSTVTATATVGGITNTIAVTTAAPLALNMPVTFSGSGFNLTAGYQYYIVNIDYVNNLIQVAATLSGTPIQLSTVASGSMPMTYPRYSGYLTAPTTNMIPNIVIQFTGVALGGVSLGTNYYIQDIIDSNNFTISSSLITLSSTATTGGVTNSITVSSTLSLVPLTPVVFSGTVFDGAITSGTTYYISNLLSDNVTFQIATSITRTTVASTQFSTNLITLGTVTNFVVGQPIIFSGIAPNGNFGGIIAETVYYILTINPSTNQITISTDKTNTFALTTAGGILGGTIFARTCTSDAAVQLGGGTGTMTVTSTGPKVVVTNSVGVISTMNATFSTTLFGGLNSYTVYYVTAINPGTTPTMSISATKNGTPLTLTSGVGAMQLAASGWDNINAGTPVATALDTTTAYYIEPRVAFVSPPNSQTTSTVTTPLTGGATWNSIAYGNNYFLAIPNTGSIGGQSSDGVTWSSMILPSGVSNWTSIVSGNSYWIALGTQTSGSVSVAAYSNSNGTGWRTTALPSNSTWNKIVYGNGTFVAIASGTTNAAYSTNYGRTWSASSTGLLATKTWVGLTYGDNLFLAIANDGTGAWSYDGNNWQATTLPKSTGTLTGITITGGAGSFSCTASANQLVVGQTVVISGTNTAGDGSAVSNGTYYISATNGKTTFTLSSTYPSVTPISTSAGSPTQIFTIGAPSYSALAWGDNRFVAVQIGNGLRSAYSFDGISWYQSLTYMSATNMISGQGCFVAVNSNSTTAYKSENGVYWSNRTLTYGNISALGFGYNTSNIGIFLTLSNTGSTTGDATIIFEGSKTQGRATVTSGVITAVSIWEPGSNYSVAPTIAFYDYNAQVNALVVARVGNGALGNPTFVNRGSRYNTTSTVVTITGNGYADTYQTGYTLIINNLASLPLVGSNLSIAGNSQVYKVTSAVAVFGTVAPFIEANVQISPTMSTALSPANGTAVSLRQLYSQCRLTGHDLLSIGTGNKIATNYPTWDETTAKIQNQAVETNQGHVFYTSTDENGNFNVGGLFGVQQSTGTVTLSATQFGLQGLNTLSLGGIAVGSSSVIVTQFSTDATFVANSDTIIPTQRAIKSYLTGRLSQGGANTYTGSFVAGTVFVGGPNFIKSTVTNGQPGSSVKIPQKVYINASGVDGNMAAFDMFMRSGAHR